MMMRFTLFQPESAPDLYDLQLDASLIMMVIEGHSLWSPDDGSPKNRVRTARLGTRMGDFMVWDAAREAQRRVAEAKGELVVEDDEHAFVAPKSRPRLHEDKDRP